MSQGTLRQARLRELDAALTSGSAVAALRFERACLLAEAGRSSEARDAYIDLLEREPAHLAALNNLGTLLYEMGYRVAARTAYAEAVTRHPGDALSHVNLANVLRENGDAAKAREHYETALRLDPDFPEAHQGLSYILAESGDEAKAAHHRRRGFESRPVVSLPYRGEGRPVPLLLLASTTGGNVPIRHLLDNRIFQVSILFAEFYDTDRPLPPHQIVFNAIGDADLAPNALIAANSLLAKSTTPVINHPDTVAMTGRSDNASRLSGIRGVVPPKVVTLPRALLAGSDAGGALASHGFEFPLLIRTPGFHTGRHFLRIEAIEELPLAVAGLPGDNLTVIEYLDACGKDGKARKYRVMAIDGQMYPLHVAISSHWKVHYFSADMTDNPAHRAEEAEFLRNMPSVVGTQAMAALAGLQRKLGLDYWGVDFGMRSNGEILLFEANATMVVNPPEPDEKWDYRRAAVERIHTAVRDMLMKRSGVTGEDAELAG